MFNWRIYMDSSSRYPLLAARTPPGLKLRFESLAFSQGKSASRLLNEIVESVVERSPTDVAAPEEGASERISVRLRPGDRELLNARAAGRSMKAGSYVSMLVRAHVRGNAPLPTGELEALKVAVGQLGYLARTLQGLASGRPSVEGALGPVVRQLQDEVRDARVTVAALVRKNLESWES